jgi:type IV secretory pathway VirD2 relaxase
MANRDDDSFRPKVGPPKAGGRAPKSRFINRVLKQTAKTGRAIGKPPKFKRGRPGSRLGRGHVAAELAGRTLGPRARRVIVKTRLVNLKNANPRSTAQHLRYIERDGVTRSRERGKAYGAYTDEADANAFEERVRDDRHQFRLIVSPEDANEFEDLKAVTRDLMAQMERDLGTKLDWVAVDHFDTDNPHTHLLLRGKDENGRDLIISPAYISHGMRARASEVLTRWLGQRTELEIREGVIREVTQERWTSLDRAIQQDAEDGVITLLHEPSEAEARFQRGLMVGRLDRLAQMGLATKLAPHTYRLAPRVEETLRAMGERGDIIRTLQRAMSGERRAFAVFDHVAESSHIEGRIAGIGADELSSRGHLIVDGVDGRAYYVMLPKGAELKDFPRGGIVEVRGGAEPRPADRTIAELAQDGIYRTARHRERIQARGLGDKDPDMFIAAHERRLEALRRAGVVERINEGEWRVPNDLAARGRAYDIERADGARVLLRSHLPIEQQVHAMGPTWLDRQWPRFPDGFPSEGFGGHLLGAMHQRGSFLQEHGLAYKSDRKFVVARDLLEQLRARELTMVTDDIETAIGLPYAPVQEGRRVSGIYRRSLMLLSGRFALLDDGVSFALVPWRPVIERRLDQPMSAVVRGEFVSWEFGRRHDLSI